MLAVWTGYRQPGARVLLVSASDDAAKRLLAECRDIATRSPVLAPSVVDEQVAVLTLSNGSRIKSAPS
jgi:hypothetical protein